MAHNGSKVQIGGSIAIDGAFPFLDHFKNGQGWSSSGNHPYPAQFDANMWPTTLGGVTLSNKIYLPSRLERHGQYCIEWQGNGTVQIINAVLQSGSYTSSTGSGFAKFTLSSDATLYIVPGITALTDQITNIRIYHEDDAPISRGGSGAVDTQIFSTKFVNYLKNYGVIRFTGIMDGGALSSGMSNITTWATRKSQSCAIWSCCEIRSSMGVTASYALNGSSNDYSSTYGDGVSGPVDKETIMWVVPTTATNTTCTFNKNGTGAVPIIRQDALALTNGTKPDAGSSKIATLVYCAKLSSWMIWGGNTTNGSLYLGNGWPIEVCVELCNQVGAHPYFSLPQYLFDPISDYASSLATYLKGRQDTDMTWIVPRVSPSNECWNSGFSQTQYAAAVQKVRNGASLGALSVTAFSYAGGVATIIATGANALPVGAAIDVASLGGITTSWNSTYVTATNVGGNPDRFTTSTAPASGTWTSGGTVTGKGFDYHNWYGRALSELGQAIAAVWGVAKANVKTQTKYQVVCEVQTIGAPSSSNDRLAAAQYVILGGDAPSGWTTTIANAQYISPTDRGLAAELGKAWKLNQGDTTQAAAYVATMPNALTTLASAYDGWKTWAQGFSIAKMCGYEGNYSPDYLGSGATVTCTITAATKDATGCVLTLSGGTIESGVGSNTNGCFDSNCVGITFSIASVAGMTQLNGLTPTLIQFTGPNQIKINVDSSGFSTYTSGGTITVTNGRNLINNLRYAAKLDETMTQQMLNGLRNFSARTGVGFTAEFPSMFLWATSSNRTDGTGVIGDGGIWGILDPDIYATVSPQFDAIKLFNSSYRRARLVASP